MFFRDEVKYTRAFTQHRKTPQRGDARIRHIGWQSIFSLMKAATHYYNNSLNISHKMRYWFVKFYT